MGAGASPSSIPSSVPLVETDAQPETPGAQTQSPHSRAPPFPSCRLILPADSPQGDLTVNPLRIRAVLLRSSSLWEPTEVSLRSQWQELHIFPEGLVCFYLRNTVTVIAGYAFFFWLVARKLWARTETLFHRTLWHTLLRSNFTLAPAYFRTLSFGRLFLFNSF